MASQKRQDFGKECCLRCKKQINYGDHSFKHVHISTEKIEGVCCTVCLVLFAQRVCNDKLKLDLFYAYLDIPRYSPFEIIEDNVKIINELKKLIYDFIPIYLIFEQCEWSKHAYEIVTKYINFETHFDAIKFIMDMDPIKLHYLCQVKIEDARQLLEYLYSNK